MITDFTLGMAIRIRATFRDGLTGAIVDPDNVVLRVRQGGGAAATTVYQYGVATNLTKVAVGIYDLIITLTAAGKGSCREVSTNTRPASAVAYWNVSDPGF